NVTANAQVVKRRARSAQAANRVAQTVANRHLRQGHAQQLIVTGESAYAPVAAVARDTLGQFVMRQIFQKLREQRSSLVHATKQKGTPAEAKMSVLLSNRLRPLRAESPGNTERFSSAAKR